MESIAEIMDMLDWHRSAEIQSEGRELARKLKDIKPFLQPLDSKYNKNVWENCAVIIAEKSDYELKPHLTELLEWLQDMNWPGADVIFYRLAQMPEAFLSASFSCSMDQAIQTNDIPWQQALNDLMRQYCSNQV